MEKVKEERVYDSIVSGLNEAIEDARSGGRVLKHDTITVAATPGEAPEAGANERKRVPTG